MADQWFSSKFTAAQLDGKTLYFQPPPQNKFAYGNMHVQANDAGLIQVDVDYGGPDIVPGRVYLDQNLINGLTPNTDASIHANFVIQPPTAPPPPPADDGWVTSKFTKNQIDGKKVCFSIPGQTQRLCGHFRVQQNPAGKLHVIIEHSDGTAPGKPKQFVVTQDLMNQLEALKQPVDFLLF